MLKPRFHRCRRRILNELSCLCTGNKNMMNSLRISSEYPHLTRRAVGRRSAVNRTGIARQVQAATLKKPYAICAPCEADKTRWISCEERAITEGESAGRSEFVRVGKVKKKPYYAVWRWWKWSTAYQSHASRRTCSPIMLCETKKRNKWRK